MPGLSITSDALRARRRSAFTLVEMLVVMGIIVLLLAATLPALRGLNQSESRRGAVGNMMGVLDRARMMAITDGLATYVVFACKTSTGTQISSDLWGHSYAIFQDGDNVLFVPAQKTPWMSLPKGLSFKTGDSAVRPDGSTITVPSILTCYLSTAAQSTDPAFPLTKAAKSNPADTSGVQLPFWKFDSTGVVTLPASIQSQTPEDYLKLLIFPGSTDPVTGKEISTQNANGAGNKQSAQLEEIRVIPSTGRAKYTADPSNNLSNNLSTPSSTP